MIHYTITKNNDVIMYSETNDIEAYRNFTLSPEVARAMDEDGVERDTVKLYALEKDLIPS